jgi:hypothetical protein
MRKMLYGAAVVLSSAVMLAGCAGNGAGNAGADGDSASVETTVATEGASGDGAGGQTVFASGTDLGGNSTVGASPSAESGSAAVAQADVVNACGIYIHNEATGNRELVNGIYSGKWEKGKDIMCFEVFNSNKATLTGSSIFKYLWEPIWFGASDASNYRIGYEVQFSIDGGATKVDQMLLMPEDTEKYKAYMEFYMYDDYHQTPGVWYSHVEQKAYDDSTLLTSIKFTAGQKYDQISGDVTLTAFLYNPSTHCFDADGHYTGDLKYTITVRNVG